MAAAIITIGDEILSGNTPNSNADDIITRLNYFNIPVKWILTVGDDISEIKTALEFCRKRAKWVFITGGLGPTHDDVTRTAVCDYFNTSLVFCPTVLEHIRERFARRGLIMPEVNRAQAYLPGKAEIMTNRHGTAPGMKLQQDGVTFCFMPGVPHEMHAMLDENLATILMTDSTPPIGVKTFHVTGISESALYEKLTAWIDRYPSIKVSFLPRFTHIDIVLRYHLLKSTALI